ncbi:hypothetical protein HGRIS_008477 [Hohenbuehelia grisea]|uniref:DUF5648 domain-containing protein n=1 Tax=Hohenbuehelia grisea TaxID=104357 RepID=A0ABR3J8I8_9AGAR
MKLLVSVLVCALAGQFAAALPQTGVSSTRAPPSFTIGLPVSPVPLSPTTTSTRVFTTRIPSSTTTATPPVITDSCEYADALAGQNLYRGYNSQPGKEDHIYTTNPSEIPSGFSNDGVVARVYNSGPPGSIPIYRLFSEKLTDHFYTMSATERDDYAGKGYTWNGIVGYGYAFSTCSGVPLYRLYSEAKTNNFYTIDPAEVEKAVLDGYKKIGVTGYVFQPKKV